MRSFARAIFSAISGSTLLVGGLTLTFVSGCAEPNKYEAPPPPEVTVAIPVRHDIDVFKEETGQTRAEARVELRARVKGTLESMHFAEGTDVNKGDLLFTIEQDLYQARMDQAAAEVVSLERIFDKTDSDFQRMKRLRDSGASTDEQYTQAEAAFLKSAADVQAAKAMLKQAVIDFGYTEIRSPISGVVSEKFVDVGNLVGNNEATLLAEVVSYDPIYVYFAIDELTLLRLLESRNDRDDQPTQDAKGKRTFRKIPVELRLQNQSRYSHAGLYDYADLGVDEATGTFMVRAIFRNRGTSNILPGLFAQVRFKIDQIKDAILVPDAAISKDQAGSYVLVVDEKNVVQRQPVTTGALENGFRVILEGLTGEERVVINGLQRARPGATVDPQQESLTFEPVPRPELPAELNEWYEEMLKKRTADQEEDSESPTAEPDAVETSTENPAQENPSPADTPKPDSATEPTSAAPLDSSKQESASESAPAASESSPPATDKPAATEEPDAEAAESDQPKAQAGGSKTSGDSSR